MLHNFLQFLKSILSVVFISRIFEIYFFNIAKLYTSILTYLFKKYLKYIFLLMKLL